MHLSGGNGNSSHPTAGGMGETTAKQSNKHNNAEGDHDSGVDENTQHPAGESPTKKMGSGGAGTRIPKKTPPVSPTKASNRSRAPGAIGAGRVPRSKSVPKPFTSWATPPSTSDSAKKVPMNKVKVGMSQSPNIKQVRSKVGSLANATHKAGGGDIRIENRKLDWKKDGRTDAFNSSYKPGGGDKKIENRKLEWNTTSKVGSMANAKHRAGGGNVKIMDQKVKVKVQSKIGSLDNVKHKPGGGDKKVFNDVEYMRQVSDHAVSITNASGPGSLTSSRRESSLQLMSRKSSNNSEASYGDSPATKSNDQYSVTAVPSTKYQSMMKSGNGNLPSKV